MKLDDDLRALLALEMSRHIWERYDTPTKAAKAWGVSVSRVSQIINGHKPPTAEQMREAGLAFQLIRVSD